ncbi:hypothetical protein DYB32_010396 [Aphanomyces invadans]|uniref:Uncharacterized protein n=1 Tax=Aphanomyces invadans TaxID=157072 RepID=A0A3R6VP96_9STRA|nr:hypothetical protein DYB32_010396 [Aphanomyces invadans]
MWNMDDNLENLTDAKFKAKLQEIAEKPMNEVDPDLRSLFHGVKFDMGIGDVTQRVAQFMTKCDERIHLRGAKDMMRADEVRKRVYMSVLDELPGLVSRYTHDNFKMQWNPKTFEWRDLIAIVLDIAKEQQTNWERWGAGAGKRILSKSASYSKKVRVKDVTRVAQGTKAKDANPAVEEANTMSVI